MRQLVKALNELKGKEVCIRTEHKLFGNQRIEMDFEPETDMGIGFRCKGQVIYIDKDELVDYALRNNKILFGSKLMRISIEEK